MAKSLYTGEPNPTPVEIRFIQAQDQRLSEMVIEWLLKKSNGYLKNVHIMLNSRLHSVLRVVNVTVDNVQNMFRPDTASSFPHTGNYHQNGELFRPAIDHAYPSSPVG